MKIVKYHSGHFDGNCPCEDTLAVLLSEREETRVIHGKEKKVKVANLAVFQDADQVVVRKVDVPDVTNAVTGKDADGNEVDHPYWEEVKG